MIRAGDELEVKLEGFASEGKSVSRIEGFVLMVSGGVPGDLARVRVKKVKSNFAEAEVLEVLGPSPLRVVPRCRYFGVCGGCTWQQVGYDAQLTFKRQHVLDALERIGGFQGLSVQATMGSDEVFYYRNKMEFSFGARWRTREEMAADNGASSGEEERFALGLHIPGRFDRVLDLEECHLQSETSARIVNAVRTFCIERGLPVYSTQTHEGYLRNLVIRESKRTGEIMVNLVTKDERPGEMQALCETLLRTVPSITTIVNNVTSRLSQVAVGETEKTYHGPGFILETLGKRTYRISANSFFQTNTSQAERLYDTVRRMAAFAPGDLVFDLYSGTGTIALHVADDAGEVIGIEAVAQAVADAERNAEFNGVRNCRFVRGDLKESLTRDLGWLSPGARPDVVIADPPRAGMHEKVVRQIVAFAPRKIVYVSCNPATQARDLQLLAAEHRYVIDEVQPVDMFPHTYHIENVVSLSRTAV